MINLRTLFLLLLCFFAIQAATLGQTRQEALATIERMRAAKEYNDAIVLAERLLDKSPDDMELMILKAFLISDKGDRVGAYQELFALRNAYPDNDTVISSIAYLDMFSGRLDSAEANYKHCLALADDRADSFSALLNLGSVYMNQQDFPKAIRYHKDLLKQFPDSTGLMTNLAQAYARNGQEEQSLALFRKLAILLPDDKIICNNLGMLYTQMGRYPEAIKALEQGLARDPKDSYLLNNCGFALFRNNDYNRALKLINESIAENATNPYAYRNRALVYLGLKLNREACQDLAASEELGFKIYYGDEVAQLIKKHCR